jgi:hypothetical protein
MNASQKFTSNALQKGYFYSLVIQVSHKGRGSEKPKRHAVVVREIGEVVVFKTEVIDPCRSCMDTLNKKEEFLLELVRQHNKSVLEKK